MPSDDRDFEALRRREHFHAMLRKLPMYDPSWADDVQEGWWALFKTLWHEGQKTFDDLDSLAPCPGCAGLRVLMDELDGAQVNPQLTLAYKGACADIVRQCRAALAPPATGPDCDECTGLEKALTDIWVYAVEQGPNYGKQRPLSDYNRGAQEAFIEVAVMLHAALEGDGAKGKKLIAGRDVFGAPTLAPAAPLATEEEINENESD